MFEVVDFFGPYHVILGRPCYVKFMAIPSYTYLKLKIPGPTKVITMEAKAQRALDYKLDSIELVVAAVIVAELRELSLWIPSVPLGQAMPPSSNAFKAAEDAKAMQIDTKTLPKPFKSGPAWTLNMKASSSTSSGATRTYLCGVW
jgi:hypothetical protein